MDSFTQHNIISGNTAAICHRLYSAPMRCLVSLVVNERWWRPPWAPVGLRRCLYNLARSISLTVILIASRTLCRTIHCKSCRCRSPEKVAVCFGVGRTAADGIACTNSVHPISHLQTKLLSKRSGQQLAVMGGQCSGPLGTNKERPCRQHVLIMETFGTLMPSPISLVMESIALVVLASHVETTTDAGPLRSRLQAQAV